VRAERYWTGIGLLFVVVLHIGVALCYMRAFPVFNWPDEPAHFNYIRGLAEGKGFDVMTRDVWVPDLLEELRHDHFSRISGAEDPVITPIRYEAHQPPFYYVVAAGIYRSTRSVYMLKGLNLLFSCLALILTYMIGVRLFPDIPLIPIAAVLLLALQPMRAFMAVSISNDPAAECLFSLALLLILQRRKAWVIGLMAGLALLTKIHMILILPLYLLWLLMDTAYGNTTGVRVRNRKIWQQILMAGVVCVLVAMPWIWRNMHFYGITDPLALKAGALGSHAAEIDSFGRARPVLRLSGPFGIIPFVRILFQSWWGVFGWMEWFMNKTIVGVFLFLSVLVSYGLLRAVIVRVKKACPFGWRVRAMSWLTLGWGVFLLALIIYSLGDFQAQGRYLLVASSAAGLLFGTGLFYALRRWTPLGLLLTGIFLLSINLYVTLYLIPMHLH